MDRRTQFAVRRIFMNHQMLASQNRHLNTLQQQILKDPKLAEAFVATFDGANRDGYTRARQFFIAAGQGNRGSYGRKLIKSITGRLETPEGRAAFIQTLGDIRTDTKVTLASHLGKYANLADHVRVGGLVDAFTNRAKYVRNSIRAQLRSAFGDDREMGALIDRAVKNESFVKFIQTPAGKMAMLGAFAGARSSARAFGFSKEDIAAISKKVGKGFLTQIADGKIDFSKLDEKQIVLLQKQIETSAITEAFDHKLKAMIAGDDQHLKKIGNILMDPANSDLKRSILNAFIESDEARKGMAGIFNGKDGTGGLDAKQLAKILEDPTARSALTQVMDKIAEGKIKWGFVNELSAMHAKNDKAGILKAFEKHGIKAGGIEQIYAWMEKNGMGGVVKFLKAIVKAFETRDVSHIKTAFNDLSSGKIKIDVANIGEKLKAGVNELTAGMAPA